VAVQLMFWRTLCYPLPALNLTRKEYEVIMAPILNYVLPNLGIRRNFPRLIVFAPKAFFIISLKHLYMVQESFWLQDIIRHTFHESTMGLLYFCLIELLHLELGLVRPLHTLDFSVLSILATDSLVKSTWSFLWHTQIQLRTSVTFLLARDIFVRHC
jgi:hypothetical protein